MMRNTEPAIQSAVPSPGLTPLELAQDLLSRIDQGNKYARSKKRQFRFSSSTVRWISLLLAVASTIILGLQNLNVWTGTAFALIAIVTTVNTLEPFFAWRSRWVLMEDTQSRFYSLRDARLSLESRALPCAAARSDRLQGWARADRGAHPRQCCSSAPL